MPYVENTGLWRLRKASEPRAFHGRCEQPTGLHLFNEAAYIVECRLAPPWDRDGDMFHAPSSIQHARARHLVGHLKQGRLVGREQVELSAFEHFNGLP